jgi:hypothetical protein
MLQGCKHLLTIALVAGLVSAPAEAVNWRWLKYSPVESFTQQDWELLRGAARTALNEGKDGDTVNWDNPESGNAGYAQVLTTERGNGGTCRMLQLFNESGGTQGSTRLRLCQMEDGTWRVSKPKAASGQRVEDALEQLQ